jgi:hypothetical protein
MTVRTLRGAMVVDAVEDLETVPAGAADVVVGGHGTEGAERAAQPRIRRMPHFGQ